jgi:hypothetical protein
VAVGVAVGKGVAVGVGVGVAVGVAVGVNVGVGVGVGCAGVAVAVGVGVGVGSGAAHPRATVRRARGMSSIVNGLKPAMITPEAKLLTRADIVDSTAATPFCISILLASARGNGYNKVVIIQRPLHLN